MMVSTVNSDYKPEITIFKSLDAMANEFFDFLVDDITNVLMQRRKYHIVVSGGTTPLKIFEKLNSIDLDKMKWDYLHVYWGDERCVPPENPESNYGNAWNTIIRYLDIPGQNIHRIKGEDDPVEECFRYQDILRNFVPVKNGLPCFNLFMLGIGEDGHTASIFPDQMDLLTSDSLCSLAKHPVSGQLRISLSGKVINNAEKVLFIATGKSKAKLIESIVKREKACDIYPAAHINPTHGILKWYLDREAGRNLKSN